MIEKKKPLLEWNHRKEKVVLVGAVYLGQNERQTREYLHELEFLAYTAGGEVVKSYKQKINVPDPKTFIGSGKLSEIRQFVKDSKIDVVIFDDELSGSQVRNIEKILECRVIDRTNLILDIFARRARTAQSLAQVELAQYKYLLPRLTRMWTHLEKQRGGIGLRGPGETEIETDRRVIRNKLAHLKEKLKQIEKQSETQRKKRGELARVALVGYTNVGKSTLMNLLSKSDVFAENKLFATLDTTVRKVVIDSVPFLLSDTVGFIRKLPHDLIESFKSTLDEVREADIIVHVADISHPNFFEQINVVSETLAEIGVKDTPVLLVFNKIDAYSHEEKDEDDLTPVKEEEMTLEEMKRTWMAKTRNPTLFISALKKKNIDELREKVLEMVKKVYSKRYPENVKS